MYRRHSSLFALATIAFVLAVGALTAACGSSTDTSSSADTGTPSATNTFAALLPESLAQSGVIKVGNSFPYAPMEYYEDDGVTPTGLDVDLMDEIAARLGLKVEWVNMNWDGLILALQSKRFDMIASSMGDFTDRQEKISFVDYLSIGEGVLVKAANASAVTSADGLAGKTVGAAKGTIAVPLVKELSQELVDKGLPPIDLKQFNQDSLALTALQSDRIFAHVIDMPAAAWEAETAGDGNLYAVVLPNVKGGIPYGLGFRKDDTGLGQAVEGTLNEMIADGTYATILEKYGLSGGAIDQAVINGGTTASGN
jgi:polar amino acid transport system substrate-binding protein